MIGIEVMWVESGGGENLTGLWNKKQGAYILWSVRKPLKEGPSALGLYDRFAFFKDPSVQRPRQFLTGGEPARGKSQALAGYPPKDGARTSEAAAG